MADERTEKQKVQEITDKLEEGLKELFESEKYKAYLSTMSKFHNYSFNNTLLIAMQKPEATLVAGYKAWQKNFERHVNKGEKAIRILAPAPYKIKEERDKLDPVTGEMMFDENGMPQKEQVEVTIPAFRAVSVFDVSQTDGKPIPELEAQELLSRLPKSLTSPSFIALTLRLLLPSERMKRVCPDYLSCIPFFWRYMRSSASASSSWLFCFPCSPRIAQPILIDSCHGVSAPQAIVFTFSCV